MSQHTPKTYAYIKFQTQYKAEMLEAGVSCHICGKGFWPDAPKNSRGQLTIDHVVPLSRGGNPTDPYNCRPAHRGCNSRRGNRPAAVVAKPVAEVEAEVEVVEEGFRPHAWHCWSGCSQCADMKDTVGRGSKCPRVLEFRRRRALSRSLSS